MRLRWFVALEILVAGGLAAGAAAGGRALLGGGRQAARAPVAAPRPIQTAARPALAPLAPASAAVLGDLGDLAPAPAPAPEGAAPALFDGARDDILLERSRAGRITAIKFNRGGSSVSLRLTFADGSRAACKPDQTNLQSLPRKEIAAYRINRLLGLSGVPPAAARRLTRQEVETLMVKESRVFLPRIREEVLFDRDGVVGAEVSHWIPEIRDARLEKDHIPAWEAWLRQGGALPAGRGDFARQLSGMLALDLLTSNYDRFTGTNDLMSPDGRTLYAMDNTIGFWLEPEGHPRPREHFVRCQRFSRRVYERLRAFTEPALRAELAKEPNPPWTILSDAEIAAVMQRRDFALKHIGRLIEAHGAARVLVWP
ncbi:MAG TPA: hypothetical protein VGQ83_24995 [Polyangia bacterium]